ncbi:MAG: hypothetical protein ACW967_06785 [Candidatus Hodarchaeales archaeon]|jgi:hypothetical protein
MIKIHIYGFLKRKFYPDALLTGDTIIKINYIPNETFSQLLDRLDVKQDEIGDCFVNGKIAKNSTLILDNSRIGLFSFGMRLLDGGQHIKGHGFVTKPSPTKLNTWSE